MYSTASQVRTLVGEAVAAMNQDELTRLAVGAYLDVRSAEEFASVAA